MCIRDRYLILTLPVCTRYHPLYHLSQVHIPPGLFLFVQGFLKMCIRDRMCAWGLRKTISFRSVTRFPSASTGMPEESLTGGLGILISAIMPSETKESRTNSCTRRMFSCRDNSWGSATSISRASLQSRLFSASSTADVYKRQSRKGQGRTYRKPLPGWSAGRKRKTWMS